MIIDGKGIAAEIREELKLKIGSIGQSLTLAIIQVGDLPQSNLYIKQKKRVGALLGVEVMHITLSSESTFDHVKNKIEELNVDESITGIILQLPLPEKISEQTNDLVNCIDPKKDADGLTAHNLGSLVRGAEGIVPATPKGIISLCRRSGIEIAGKKVAVVGRSFLVGKPAALAFLAEDATVTIAHSKTIDLKEITQSADIVIAAIGRAKFFDASYFRVGQAVIDVGINEFLNGDDQTTKMVGDVDFDEVSKIVAAITPVPGGVGPMTVISLFENLFYIGLHSNKYTERV